MVEKSNGIDNDLYVGCGERTLKIVFKYEGIKRKKDYNTFRNTICGDFFFLFSCLFVYSDCTNCNGGCCAAYIASMHTVFC